MCGWSIFTAVNFILCLAKTLPMIWLNVGILLKTMSIKRMPKACSLAHKNCTKWCVPFWGHYLCTFSQQINFEIYMHG